MHSVNQKCESLFPHFSTFLRTSMSVMKIWYNFPENIFMTPSIYIVTLLRSICIYEIFFFQESSFMLRWTLHGSNLWRPTKSCVCLCRGLSLIDYTAPSTHRVLPLDQVVAKKNRKIGRYMFLANEQSVRQDFWACGVNICKICVKHSPIGFSHWNLLEQNFYNHPFTFPR